MKYWRGYLVAAIAGACSWGLMEFSKAHTALVDMIYPYMTRMVQNFLADWSAGASFCLWQVLLLVLGAVVLATAVLMIVFKWNPIQWFGWVLAGASLLFFANTVIFGLNDYSGPLAEDIRLQNIEYKCDISELEQAAQHYRDQANALALEVKRDENGNVQLPSFEELNAQAAEGFDTLVMRDQLAIFAGSTLPVKTLDWAGMFTARGVTGLTVALTGEAAVNPQVPAVGMPFAICQQMACRMAIAREEDSQMAAFLACTANSAPEFRYSGYLVSYWHLYHTLSAIYESTGGSGLEALDAGMNEQLRRDLQAYSDFFPGNEGAYASGELCDLLGVWYVEKYILPLQKEEKEPFDPTDEEQVDLSGIVNAKG